MGLRILKKAIKNTDEFVWYITYLDIYSQERLMTLYASSARKAAKKAEQKLQKQYGVWYKIKSISTV